MHKQKVIVRLLCVMAFYIHDSSKGFSHGCIEVEGRFFFVLRDFAKSQSRPRLILKVEYKVGQATNGGTKQ